MLINHTAEKLRSMKLPAMAAEYIRQSELPVMSALSFDERIGMIADAEWLSRENRKAKQLIKDANLRFSTACFADIDYRTSRKLDRAYVARLSDFTWVKEAKTLILTGCTGTGKTWLACAFGAEACRIGLRVVFYRVSRLFNEMSIAAGCGNMGKLLARLKKADILILDDWGLMRIALPEGQFLHEVFEERCDSSGRSTIIAAQLPVLKWHELFDSPTTADAVLDRIVHQSHRIELYGPSLRSLAHASSNSEQLLDSLSARTVEQGLGKEEGVKQVGVKQVGGEIRG